MKNVPDNLPPEWNLGEWEGALTINVGTTYVCRICENVVMVTRGGLGVLNLECCGKPMERVKASEAQG